MAIIINVEKEDLEKLEFTYTVSENVKWYGHFAETVCQFLQKVNIKLPQYTVIYVLWT